MTEFISIFAAFTMLAPAAFALVNQAALLNI